MESIKKLQDPPSANHEIEGLENGDEPLRQIGRALVATASSLAKVRDAFEVLCRSSQVDFGDAVTAQPLLLTVPQVCDLLGYRKTKVYVLMKRGLLPYIVETKTGHRRVEYRALQQFVKRLRGGRLEWKAS